MLLVIVGALLMALGLFAGCVLVVVPLGLAAWSAGLVIWILFPVLSIVGYTLLVTAARPGSARLFTVAASVLLLVLAVGSALALVLDAASIVHTVGSTLPLWYVLAVAGTLGVTGAASYSRTGTSVP